jgi:hypothetical protein
MFLNIVNELARLIRPINESDFNIIYTFVCELVSTIFMVISGFKKVVRFLNPQREKNEKINKRDILIVFLYILVGLVSPISIILIFLGSVHTFWWYVVQVFSGVVILSFLGTVYLIRKVNKILNEEGL